MEGYPTNDTQTNTNSTESTNQVNEVESALNAYKADDNGQVVIPEGTQPHVATALKLEQRRRNSNSEYSKERARADKAIAENEALKAQMAGLATPQGFTAEQAAELEELKFTDPDAWFLKKQAMEQQASTATQARVNEAVEQAGKVAETAYTNQVNQSRDNTLVEMLNTHNTLNPDAPITKEMLSLNIPPVLVQQYHAGDVDGASFLANVSKFLYAGRTVKTEPTLNQPNFSDAQGTSTPGDKAETKSLDQLYAGI